MSSKWRNKLLGRMYDLESTYSDSLPTLVIYELQDELEHKGNNLLCEAVELGQTRNDSRGGSSRWILINIFAAERSV